MSVVCEKCSRKFCLWYERWTLFQRFVGVFLQTKLLVSWSPCMASFKTRSPYTPSHEGSHEQNKICKRPQKSSTLSNYIILTIIGMLCHVSINCINRDIWNFPFLLSSIPEEICVNFILPNCQCLSLVVQYLQLSLLRTKWDFHLCFI